MSSATVHWGGFQRLNTPTPPTELTPSRMPFPRSKAVSWAPEASEIIRASYMRLFAKIWQSCPAGDAIPGHRHSFPTGDQFSFSRSKRQRSSPLMLNTHQNLYPASTTPRCLHDRPDPPKSTYLLLLRHLSSRGYLFVARRGFLVALLNKDICLHSWIRTMSRRG